jgi:hypothetical protein
VTGLVDATAGRGTGCLIAGRYASTRRFLEVEAGMSQHPASATIARARDLRGGAFTETVTDLLDDHAVGTHNGIDPQVTVTVDLARFGARLGGELAMPGSDTSVLIADETVRRILCHADPTTVVVRPLALAPGNTPTDPATCPVSLADLLRESSREVLNVGRAERTVPPRLRKALEARDRHCAFPHCHAHVRRC